MAYLSTNNDIFVGHKHSWPYRFHYFFEWTQTFLNIVFINIDGTVNIIKRVNYLLWYNLYAVVWLRGTLLHYCPFVWRTPFCSRKANDAELWRFLFSFEQTIKSTVIWDAMNCQDGLRYQITDFWGLEYIKSLYLYGTKTKTPFEWVLRHVFSLC